VACEILSAAGRLLEFDGVTAVIEVPREQITHVAAELLARLPVADVSISEVQAEEIIRQIFAGQVLGEEGKGE
ncbi:MAG TPA: ABC transporter, partial [Armatimonadota bacterium]|nr:ABC transporter [Armatimonadota bacterium]